MITLVFRLHTSLTDIPYWREDKCLQSERRNQNGDLLKFQFLVWEQVCGVHGETDGRARANRRLLVTAGPGFDGWAYSPDESAGYSRREEEFDLKNLKLFEGSFEDTRDFRWSLYTEKISDMDDALSDEDGDFSGKYL
jgi:hypothetical protein